MAEVDGPAAGLAIARQVAEAPALRGYYLLPATLGELHRRLGDREAAAAAFGQALRFGAGGTGAALSPRKVG